MSRSWGSVSVNVNEEHELIATLALQHRNGSDASFKVCLCDRDLQIQVDRGSNKLLRAAFFGIIEDSGQICCRILLLDVPFASG